MFSRTQGLSSGKVKLKADPQSGCCFLSYFTTSTCRHKDVRTLSLWKLQKSCALFITLHMYDIATNSMISSTFLHVPAFITQCSLLSFPLLALTSALVPGVLVPTQKRDGRRLTWWINWLNFWGAVMYCIGYAVMQFTAWWYGSRMLMSYHKAVTKCNVSTQVCDTCRFTLPPCERPVHALSAIVLLYLVHLSVISIVSVRLCISKSCRRGRG